MVTMYVARGSWAGFCLVHLGALVVLTHRLLALSASWGPLTAVMTGGLWTGHLGSLVSGLAQLGLLLVPRFAEQKSMGCRA